MSKPNLLLEARAGAARSRVRTRAAPRPFGPQISRRRSPSPASATPDGEHRREELLVARRLDGARHGGREEVAHARASTPGISSSPARIAPTASTPIVQSIENGPSPCAVWAGACSAAYVDGRPEKTWSSMRNV